MNPGSKSKDPPDLGSIKKIKKYLESLKNKEGERITYVECDKNDNINDKKRVNFINEKNETYVDVTRDEVFKLIFDETEEKQMEECNELINVMYECHYCHYGSSSKNVLKKHMKSHIESKGYKCQVCHVEFRRLKTFQCHCKSIYELQRREHSKKCESLQSKERSVADENNKCDGLLTKKDEKNIDDKLHRKRQKLVSFFQKQKKKYKLYSCCTCNKSFEKKRFLNKHSKLMHKLSISHDLKCQLTEKVDKKNWKK